MANNTIDIKQLETIIKNNITTNGSNLITGKILQEVLLSMINGMKYEAQKVSANLSEKLELALATAQDAQNKLSNLHVYTDNIVDGTVKKIDLNEEITDYLLTDKQKEYIDYLISENLKKDALDKFSVNTACDELTFYNDNIVYSQINIPYEVSLTFNGHNYLKANEIPKGFIENKENATDGTIRYKYITYLTSSNKEIKETEFKYTISDNFEDSKIYNGITLAKNSKNMTYHLVNPAWYGFVTLEDIKSQNYIKGLNRLTSNFSNIVNIQNNTGKEAQFIILTKASASAEQIGNSILNNPKENIQFTSILNDSINLTGYRLYTSINTIANGSFLNNVLLNIKL